MKRALVVGGARSGKYIALLLNEHDYDVTLTDINIVNYKDELQAKGIEVVDGSHPDSLLEVDYDIVVKNPGIKYTTPFIQKLLQHDYKIYNEIEVSLMFVEDVNIIAVSGTNGKTTTVSLLGEMMKAQYANSYVAGNIGNAVSETIYNHRDLKHLVVEMSSFQLDGTYDFKPHTATLTNLQQDHLDYYANLDDYYASKQKIYENQDEDDFFILNADDEVLTKYLNTMKSKVISYGIDRKSDIEIIEDNVIYDGRILFNTKEISLVGKHNLYNALSAALMAYVNGVSPDIISKTLKTFKGVEHRIEYVATIHDVKYYNDSKATNVESVLVALQSFDSVILIAGGYDKNISFERLRDCNDVVKQAILFGETKDQLARVFDRSILVDNLEQAVAVAASFAKNGDVVLFSPACASFDQFRDFEHRGQKFKDFVNKL